MASFRSNMADLVGVIIIGMISTTTLARTSVPAAIIAFDYGTTTLSVKMTRKVILSLILTFTLRIL